jgi:hypothetical protein
MCKKIKEHTVVIVEIGLIWKDVIYNYPSKIIDIILKYIIFFSSVIS